MSKEVAEEYVSSLAELTNNSKPHINMLTMLADDNIVHAPAIVEAVEKHLHKVPPDIKLPVLYLIDSIVKNVGQAYTELFSQNIVDMFCDVFAKVDEKTRAQMFKLRQTWNSVFPLKSLFILDTKVNKLDPAWPITAQPPIHVNPKFFNVSSSGSSTAATPPVAQASSVVLSAADAAIKEQLLKKQKKLLELQQEKLELQLMQTKAKLEEQQKQLEKQTGHLKSSDSLAALSKLIKKDGGKFVVLNTKASKSSIVTSSQTVLTKSQLNKTPSKVEVKSIEGKPSEAVKSSISKIPEQILNKTNILLKPYAAADFKPLSKSETSEKFKSVAKSAGQKAEARVKVQEAVLGKPRGLQDPWTVPTPPTQQVRIAPVSSQLISAARRARDPRIRKLENAENTLVMAVSGINANSSHIAVGIKPSSTSVSDSAKDAAVVKTKSKTEMNIEQPKSGKNRKDRKSSSHRSREEKYQKKMAKIVKHYKTDKLVGYDKKQTVEETKSIGRSITNNDSKQSDVTEVKIPGKRSSDNSEKALVYKPSDIERTITKSHEEAVVNAKLKLQRPAQIIPEKSSHRGQESESAAPVKADRIEKFISRHSDIVKPLHNKNSDNTDKPIRTFVNKSDVSQTQTSSDASAANKNVSDSDKQNKNVDSVRTLTNKANDKSDFEKYSESLQKSLMDFETVHVPENDDVIPSSKHVELISSPIHEFGDEHTKVPIVEDKASKFVVSEDRYNSKTDYDERTLLLESKISYNKLKSDLFDELLLKKPLSNEELDKRKSPQSSEKRLRRSDQKMTIMEKMLASTEVDEASPSPPPPPVISDKFKEVKSSSLSRLRKYVRNRDGSESPPSISTTTTTTDTTVAVAPVTTTTTVTTVADVDLRQPPVSVIGDQKNDVAVTASADKDVDLRQLPTSPKKRPSVDRSELPPSKKSKAEMFHDNKQESSWEDSFENDQVQNYCHSETRLFGSEDVDLRPQLSAAPLPSPPPPPIISRSPPPPSDKEDKENASERLWAKYKQQKPDSFKSSYRQNNQFKSSPAFRRGQGPFAQYDRRRLLSGEDEDTWHTGRQWYGEDTDMRTSFIINEANQQLKTGNITELQYQKVLSEVVTMNEKQKLAEAQFKDEEEERMLYERNEELEPISDDEGSFTGSLSPTQNDEVISSISDPNSSSKPDRDSETSNPDQANLEPYDPGDSVVKHDSADVDHRMYNKGEHCKLRSGVLEVPTSRSESDIDNRIPMDVSHLDSTNETGDVTYERYTDQRENQRGQRQDRKQRRRKEDRDHRDKPYRKIRFNQIGPGNWVPFDGRHKNIDSQMGMEYSDTRKLHKDFIHNQVISSDMRSKGSTDNRNFQDSSEMLSFSMNVHSSRYGNDSNLMETGHKDFTPMHSVAPWDRSRQPPPMWMRGTVPPLLRYPPPFLMKPPGYNTTNRWRVPPPGTAPMRPMFGSDIRFNRFVPPNMAGRFPLPGEIPPSDPVMLDMITADPTVSICIDNKLRDIRFYGDTAVALMDWDDPREISFVSGQRRKLIVDDRESFILPFNTPYKEVLIDGQPHRIKLGAPTRELYIDGKFYEVRFGGPPVNIDIGGKIRSVQLDGPTPTVMRSSIKRTDLVLGKIKLIVDAQIYFPVFLDAKPQRFDIEGIPYILQFVEALQMVLINGVPFKAEFGGLPKPIVLNGKKHFFRLSSLPRGITPGHVTIVNMEGGRLPSPPMPPPPPVPVMPPPPQIPLALQLHDLDIEPDTDSESNDPMLHLTSEPNLIAPTLSPEEGQAPTEITNTNSEIILNPQAQNDSLQQPAVSAPPTPAPSNHLDMLASLMPTDPALQVNYSYSVENEVPVTTSAEQTSQPTQTQSQTPSSGTIPFLSGEINVPELLQKLVASGIVPGPFEETKMPSKEKPVEPESDTIKPVDFLKTETLKTRQPGLIATLYSGIQCSSCGVRFAPEQTMKYSQHLDWHFRQNRRDKDSARTAQSRKWYYDVSDWIQFEEIEDLEERAQSWFESQVGQSNINAESEEPAKEIPSVAAGEYGEDAACEICRDKFEQFYNEEREEWHLRQAIKVDNKLYHPICYQDYRASLDAPIEISLDESTPKEDEAEPSTTIVDDDNDDVIECEIIKEEVPFEDLTVSDCESVHDEKEENPKMEEEPVEAEISNSETTVIDAETKDEGEPTKSEDVVDVKDDASQDVSAVDLETVVKNIKKEPEDGDLDGSETSAKNEKEDVPLPEPVVDTTHVEVACSIDGNLQFEEKHQLAVSAPPKIKINITKTLTAYAPRDSKESESDATDEPETPSTTSGTAIVVPPPQTLLDQPPPPGEEPTPIILPRKPRLVGKKLQELPPVSKGTELSGLCSIM